MSRSYPVTFLGAATAPATGTAILALIDIDHSSFPTQRIVNDMNNITSGGNIYTAIPFSLQLPDETDEVNPIIKVRFTNVTREFVSEVRTIAGGRERILVTTSLIEHTDPDTVLISWPSFELIDVSYDENWIDFTLALTSFLNEGFPGNSFDPSNFPGLF